MFPLRQYVAKLAQQFEKIGSIDFVRMSRKDVFLDNLAHFSQSYDFGAITPLILSNFMVQLAQAQKP